MKNANRNFGAAFTSTFPFLAALVPLLVATPLLADAPPALTTIHRSGTDLEGRKEYTLEWDAASNTIYRIQTRVGFESNTTWETFDLAVPTGPRGVFKLSDDKAEANADQIKRFFQVLAPQPEIFRVEPALVGPNGGTVFLFGQCLGTNATLRIGGLVISLNTLQPGSLYSFNLASGVLAEGTYDVEVLDGTNVLATASKLFSVIGQPTPVGEAAQRLLEVPEMPPGSPSTSLLMPALMKAKEKANRTKCSSDWRIMPATGEVLLQEEDLVVPGRGLDFVWARTYRSRTGTNASMGQGWSHSYDIRAYLDAGGVVIILDGTGRSDRYFLQTNGVYTADELLNEVTISNGVCTVTFPDTGKWEFNSSSNIVAPGKILRCVDRHGNALTFNYDSSSRLSEIIDTLGRTNRVNYDFFGRVVSVVDFSGRACTYTYWRFGQVGGGDGDLRSVTTPPVTGTPNTNDFPLGKTTTYTYSQGFADNRLNHNLLTITDPKGQTALEVSYAGQTDPLDVDFDRVLSCAHGAVSLAVYNYSRQTPASSNGWAVVKTICNDPAGNVTIDWFDSLNRCVIHRDLAARAVPGTPIGDGNLPTTKPRATDPDFWQTTFEWNLDSLCTRVIYPRGNSTEVVYQRAQDHNSSRSNKTRRGDGNPRVIRERACCRGGDVDGDGAADLVTRLDFDPRFGFDPTVFGKAINTKPLTGTANKAINTKPLTGTYNRVLPTVNKREAARGGWYEAGNAVRGKAVVKNIPWFTSVTDPRGNVDTCVYDAQGNRIQMTHQGHLLDSSDKPVTSYEYNPHGQLTAVVNPADANGYSRRDEFSYYDNGPQTGYCRDFTVDAMGPTVRITSYEYDAVGNLTQLTDPRGGVSKFHNNALNQIVFTESPAQCLGCAGIGTAFFYDANDNIVRIQHDNRDSTGALDTNNPTWTTLYEYDESNRERLIAHELAHVVQQRFATNRFSYDGNDNLISTQSPEAVNGNQPGNTVSFEYDTRDLCFRQWHGNGTPESTTNSCDYNENGFLVRAIDRAGNEDSNLRVVSYGYDGFDRCITATDAMGNVSTFAYDGDGNLIYERRDGQTNDVPDSAGNQRLAETRYEYDSLNRRTRTRFSFFDVFTELPLLDGESTTTFAYAPNGMCRSVTDDNGQTTRYLFDSSSRLITVFDPKTNRVDYSYDANDNVIGVTQNDLSDVTPGKQAFSMRYEYDALDRCVVDYDNIGNTNRYGYDSRGYLVSSTDPRGYETTFVVNGLGLRAVSDCCSAGAGYNNFSTVRTEYDDNGRRISVMDGNSNVTRYAYDALNRQIATTNADGTVESLIWSPRSNLSSRTDPNGTVTTYTYDANDRCLRKDIAPGGLVSSLTTFETYRYDGLSRCVMASNDVSMLDFSYDSMGNLEKAKQDCLAMVMSFDGVGNRLSMTYPSGRIVTSTYDALDQATSLSTSPGGGLPHVSIATFAYDGPGRLGRISRGNGVNTRLAWNGLENPKNAAGDFGWQQVSGINHQVSGGGDTIDRRVATYDRNQNKTLRQQTLAFPTGVPALTTNIMTYDALNRMSSFARNRASSAYTKSFTLDKNGNRQVVSSNGVAGIYTMDNGTPEPADFPMNQYTGTPFGAREYDHNGNMVFIPGPVGGTQFTYDYANRLVNVSRSVGPAMVPIVSFTYDALGRRISKTKYPDAPALPITTQYILDPDSDDDGVLEERVDGVARFFAVWPHMHKIAGHARISATGEIFWVHVDELGSALAVTDANTNVVERYDYDDYGSPRFLSADGVPLVGSDGKAATESTVGNEFLFRGMCWDGESGLYKSGSGSTVTDLGNLGKAVVKAIAVSSPTVTDLGNLGKAVVKAIAVSSPTVTDLGNLGKAVVKAIAVSSPGYFDPQTGRGLTRVWGDPHVDEKDGTRWDFSRRSFANNNPWSEKSSSGDPVHGVDVKLGWGARSSNGDPIHGVDVKLGWGARGGGGGGGGCGGIAIDESGVHFAGIAIDEQGEHFAGVMFNPKEYVLKKEEGGRHTPFHNKVSVRGWNPTQKTAFAVLLGRGDGGCLYYEQAVITAREAGSGMATGRRSVNKRAFGQGKYALDLD